MPRDHYSSRRLRTAIDLLPVRTRVAMLEGVRSDEIISGAYVDGDGVCPMLAAHRRGGRTDFIAFAYAWDGFTGVNGRARRASQREIEVLVSHLHASLEAEEQVDLGAAIEDHRALVRHGGIDLAAARAEHRELLERRALREEHDESAAPAGSDDRAWRIPGRRRGEYDRALARVEAERERILAIGQSELA
jgi:hypothetical protein